MSELEQSGWELKGRGFCTVCLFRVPKVQPLVPSPYEIKTFLPGYTLGGFYGIHYDASPVGAYDELIVFPTFVGYGDRSGFHVSHIFVSSEKALRGGFDHLESPRQLKRFAVEFHEHKWSFTMYEAGETAFASSGRFLTPAFPFNFSVPFLDEARNEVRWFSAVFDSKIQLTTARMRISGESPFVEFGPARRLVSVAFQSLHVMLGLPMVVPKVALRSVGYAAPVAPAH